MALPLRSSKNQELCWVIPWWLAHEKISYIYCLFDIETLFRVTVNRFAITFMQIFSECLHIVWYKYSKKQSPGINVCVPIKGIPYAYIAQIDSI